MPAMMMMVRASSLAAVNKSCIRVAQRTLLPLIYVKETAKEQRSRTSGRKQNVSDVNGRLRFARNHHDYPFLYYALGCDSRRALTQRYVFCRVVRGVSRLKAVVKVDYPQPF